MLLNEIQYVKLVGWCPRRGQWVWKGEAMQSGDSTSQLLGPQYSGSERVKIKAGGEKGGRMGAVGKQGVLICTKMQLSFASGRRAGAGEGYRRGAGAASPPAGTGEGGAKGGRGRGRVAAGGGGGRCRHLPPSAPPAQPAGAMGRREITCKLGLSGGAKLGVAEERVGRRTQ